MPSLKSFVTWIVESSELKEIPQKRPRVSQKTIDWVIEWIEHAPRELPPQDVLNELKQFRPTEPLRLWRYVQDPTHERVKPMLSWFRSLAEIMDTFDEGTDMFLRTAVVSPENVLVDITMFYEYTKTPALKYATGEIVTFQPSHQ